MHLIFWISGIAVPFYAAVGNPIPDNLPLYWDFFLDSSTPSSDFATASPFSLDSPPADALDFSDAASLPFEPDWLVGSSDTPLETDLDTGSSAGTPRENLCGTDPDFQPYFKRDGDICPSKTPIEPQPLPLLELPDLEKLEQSAGSNQVDTPEKLNFQIFPIPGYTRVGDTDNLCPWPKRRLCCRGPLSGNAGILWNIISHCRGKE